MQKKHAEVTRLTYARSIAKCQQNHGTATFDSYESGELQPLKLMHCLMHNTDKVDRRFFGYYGS